MKTTTILALALGMFASDVIATADQTEPLPPNVVEAVKPQGAEAVATSMPATSWYNREIHAQDHSMIGSVRDVLRSPLDGSVIGLVVGVGPFLGTGERNVVLAIDSVSQTTRNNRNHLIVNISRNALSTSEAFKFDAETSSWIPDGVANRADLPAGSRDFQN